MWNWPQSMAGLVSSHKRIAERNLRGTYTEDSRPALETRAYTRLTHPIPEHCTRNQPGRTSIASSRYCYGTCRIRGHRESLKRHTCFAPSIDEQAPEGEADR